MLETDGANVMTKQPKVEFVETKGIVLSVYRPDGGPLGDHTLTLKDARALSIELNKAILAASL